MANIKSAKKRILTAEKNYKKNVSFKSSVKTAIRKVLELAQEKNEKEIPQALSNLYKLCDKACSKGILHKNNAARKKSRITIAINKLLASKK